jgi:peroxiredoxin
MAQDYSYLSTPIEDINGERVTLKKMLENNTTLYVAFWASYCEPCKSEMKYLSKILTKYKDRGLAVAAISIDPPKSISKGKSYARSQKFSFPILFDPESRLLKLFNGEAVPFSVIIRPNGIIATTRTGFLPGDEQDVEKDIEALLAK